MDFPTFTRAVAALTAWRTQTNQKSFHFPDTRDPGFQKISQNENITAQEFEQAIVSLCCWRENREDLYAGEVAIGHVVNNRARAGWHGGNQYSNVIAVNQFSSMTVPGDPQLEKYPDENDTEFGKVLAAMDDLYANNLLDRTDGALYYADLRYVPQGEWFYKNIVQNPQDHPRLATIGRTTFFK